MEFSTGTYTRPTSHENEADVSFFSTFMHTLIKVCSEPYAQQAASQSIIYLEKENRIEQLLKRNVPFSIQVFSRSFPSWTLDPSQQGQENLIIEWNFQKVRHKNCSGQYPYEILETLSTSGRERELESIFPDQVNAFSIKFSAPGESGYLNFTTPPLISKHHILFPYNYCIELTISRENSIGIGTPVQVPRGMSSEVSGDTNEGFNCKSPKFSLPIDLNLPGCRNEDFESPLSPMSPDYSVHSFELPYSNTSITFSEPISLKRKDTKNTFVTESLSKRLRIHTDSEQVPTPTPNRTRSLSLPFPGSPIPTVKNKFNFNRSVSLPGPSKTNCLLGSFEESMINGRLQPLGMLKGFKVQLAASGNFCPKHSTLDLNTAFFTSSTKESGPSQYFGQADLSGLGKHGYHIPKKGTIQVTLFNPNETVIKMFPICFDMSDMPVKTQTFLRQRIVATDKFGNSELQYLIHLSFMCTKSDKLYLHNSIRVVYTPSGTDLGTRISTEVEQPQNPKYSLISGKDKATPKS